MSVSGDASEQIVKMSLDGFEVLARLTGSGAKEAAILLYAILKNQKQTKGKARLNSMLKTGKPLKIFSIKNEDRKRFMQEAKKYGILYCVLVDKNNKDLDGMTDILVKEEDASRINRIVERFKLTTIDTAKVNTVVTKSLEEKEENRKELGLQKKSKEEQLEDVLNNKPIQKEENTNKNFNLAKTEKSPQSEPSLKTSKMQDGVANKKPSVRKELAKMKIESEKLNDLKQKERTKEEPIKINNSKKKQKSKSKNTR